MARAARKLAKAAATFWFEILIWSSSELSSESAKRSHHAPRMRSSLGWGIFQIFVVVSELVGVSSLNAAEVVTEGRKYFGAKLQPAKSRVQARNSSGRMTNDEGRRKSEIRNPNVGCSVR